MIDNSYIEVRTRGIRWLFHLIRIAALIWIGWHLVRFALVWVNRDGFLQQLGKMFNTDLSNAHFALGYATGGVALFAAVVLTATIWRLFGSFLAGHLMTVDSSCQMRMVGMVGFVTTVIDIGHRPLMYMAFQDGLLAKVPWPMLFNGNDLLHLMLAAMFFAIGCVTGSAVEAPNVSIPPAEPASLHSPQLAGSVS